MSDYFDSSSNRITAGSLAQSSEVNAIRDETGAGFDKLPPAANVKANTVDYGTDSGSANTYVITMPFTQTAYTTGMAVTFNPGHNNTGASTINVDSLGAKSIKGPDGSDLASGDILTGQIITLRYNGSNFVYTGGSPISSFTGASSSATAAASSASAAASSASAASTSETNAASSASAASTSETNAASSASAASTSETNASNSATAAASSASDAAADLATFQGQYYGPLASAPTDDIAVGDLYFDTSSSDLKVCNGTGPNTWGVINTYTHPTYDGDDIDVDTTALTGAVVVSDLDFNVTTDATGHVTDANGSVATRTLTLADLSYTGDTNATITDTANVTSAGALMDSEVNNLSGIKTLTVPDSTTISVFGASLIDDADDATARQTLGLEIGTDVQAYDADTSKLDVAETRSASLDMADNQLIRPYLKDVAETLIAVGNVGATHTFDMTAANVYTATLDQNSTFTLSNAPDSGRNGSFTLFLTNGGAFNIDWTGGGATIEWNGGSVPTLTSSGLDVIVGTTNNGGNTWMLTAAMTGVA